jgi:hypothetical protein
MSTPVGESPAGVERVMRWAQLTLVDDDPGRFDLAFWLDDFRRTLSAGGSVVYYPTDIPFHHRNRWSGSGLCYCTHCRDNFRAATGFDLPRIDDPQDPARRATIVWHQQWFFDLWQRDEVRAIHPGFAVDPRGL